MDTQQQPSSLKQKREERAPLASPAKVVSEEKVSSEAKETAGVPLGIRQTEPQKMSGEQGEKQQLQQQQPLKEGEQTGGAGEGIHILPVQREISGLLKEGHGEPPSVEPSATLLVHEQRVPLSHTNDDASRKPNVPDDYVSTEESLSYKERIKEGTSRQP